MSENINYRGFDFHCHIDLHPDPPYLITRCEKKRIAVLAVTTTPKAWTQNKLWMQHSDYVHAAVGLHPELVGERYGEAGLLEELIGECRLVGEVGLDGSPQYRSSYDKQKDVFSRVLRTSQIHGGRVLTIHSRRAARDVCDLVEKHSNPDNVLCILHWFSGSLSESRRAVKAGCYFSVNAAMLKNDRGRALIRDIPSDRLLTETDAPFMSIDGRKSSPLDSMRIFGDLAGLLGEEDRVTRQRVTVNARHVFRFAGID
ncbi:MAG: TatD family hydrolase [Gammaproteobacteria bacterium]|nr:TatD family hydrolase [Gammaproteobacteria bacterium]